MNDTKRILYIENDRALTKSFNECATDEAKANRTPFGILIVNARHIAEADAILSRGDPLPDALLVDLMLPKNAEGLKVLEGLEESRRDLVRALFKRSALTFGSQDEESVRLKEEIHVVDQQIKPLIVPEGGCEIIEKLARRLDPDSPTPKPLEFPIVFFTARGLPEVKSRCEHLVGKGWLGFVEKPADEADVLQLLIRLIQQRGT